MIHYIDGTIFESKARVLVNPVNTKGVLDEGLGGQFRERSAKLYKAYRDLCDLDQVKIGNLFLYKTRSKWILNFPTRESQNSESTLEIIEVGLRRFLDVHEELDLQAVAWPHLGCGAGGLKWEDVKPLMEKYLEPLQLENEIYNYVPEPQYLSSRQMPKFGNGECLIFA